MSVLPPINLNAWVAEHRHLLKPPVGNAAIWDGDFLVMVVGGPNQRADYHVNPGGELFFQIEGDIVLKIIEDGRPRDVPIRQGELFLLPAGVPHSPQRPAGTVGLVVEVPEVRTRQALPPLVLPPLRQRPERQGVRAGRRRQADQGDDRGVQRQPQHAHMPEVRRGIHSARMKIDLHTHILPRNWPSLRDRYGYGGFVQLEHHGPGCARMTIDGKFFRAIEDNCWDPAAAWRTATASAWPSRCCQLSR